MSGLRITGLYVYPVKSMKGIALDAATLTDRGLRHDRVWMVIHPNGRFVTQRDEPRLALIWTRLEEEGVMLSLEGHGSVLLPFESGGGEYRTTAVWGDECSVVDEGDPVARWLTGALASVQPLRIVRMAPDFSRPQNHPERFGRETTTWFADRAPYLVAGLASLHELNRELERSGKAAVPMDRFRPNIVLDGLDPFEENRLEAVTAENWRIALVDHCKRCVVTTIDQRTARRNRAWEPWRTLRRINPAPGPERAPAFGQNAVLARGADRQITVGTPVRVSPRQ